MTDLGKILILFGVLMVVFGAGLVLAGRLPWLGRLPGDLEIRRDGFVFYFPIVSCLLASALATLLLNLFRR